MRLCARAAVRSRRRSGAPGSRYCALGRCLAIGERSCERRSCLRRCTCRDRRGVGVMSAAAAACIRFIMATYLPGGVVAPEPTPEMHIEDGDEPGFHRTDTTDFGVLLSGNIVAEL